MLNELMNLCLVSGPTTAKVIRHTYLRGNDAFPLYSMLSTHGLNRDVGKSEAALIKGRDNIRQWMEVNQDWKQRCLDPEKMKRYQEDGICKFRFPHRMVKAAVAFELVGGRFLRLKSVHEDLYDDRLKGLVGGGYLVGVGIGRGTMCVPNRGESLEDILERLKVESGAVTLEFMRHPDALFCNPALAAEYGLVEVVQYLIEEKGLDVNGTYDSFPLVNQPHTLPLIASLFSPDISVLKYLLTVPGADFGVKNEDHPLAPHLAGGTLLHWLVRQEGLDLDRFEAVLGHKTVDIDARLPEMDLTALHLLCSVGNHSQRDVEKMRLLLKHGANIHCRASGEIGGATPLEFLYTFESAYNTESIYWEQKVELLTQA